jgi:hypothetical protein
LLSTWIWFFYQVIVVNSDITVKSHAKALSLIAFPCPRIYSPVNMHHPHPLKELKMFTTIKKIFTHTLISSFLFLGFTQSVQASMIGTAQVVSVAAAEQNRAKVVAAFERADVQAELQKMGISTGDARARVAAMTDAETASVANQIDTLPAGADGLLGTLVFIFVLLLITDILGLTKVFPFTRSMR